MFEYWFLGLKDEGDTFDHVGTTHDFLEVVSQIAQLFSAEIAGEFVAALLSDHREKLSFLRVVDWKFAYPVNDEQTIRLHKVV